MSNTILTPSDPLCRWQSQAYGFFGNPGKPHAFFKPDESRSSDLTFRFLHGILKFQAQVLFFREKVLFLTTN